MKTYLLLLKLYLALSGLVFLMVALFHLFRLFNHWQITVGGTTIPQALSFIGLPASTGYCLLAVWLFRTSSNHAVSGPGDRAGQ